jgi:hypothetical protein
MRRTLAIAAVALLTVALSAFAAPEGKWARGKVTALSGNSLTIAVDGKDMTFTVDNTTDVVKPGGATKAREVKAQTGENPKLSELVKVGDNVEVEYTEANGAMHAKSIRGGVSAKPMTSEAEAKEATKHAIGTVSSVSGNSLTIKTKTGEETFKLVEKVHIYGVGLGTMSKEKAKEGEKMSATDALHEGDTVDVTYKDVSGTNEASAVRITKKAAAKTGTPK